MSKTSLRTHPLFATFMLILLTVIWGGTFPATKAGLEVTDPMHFLAFRFGLAILIIAPFMWGRDRKKSPDRVKIKTPLWGGVLVGFFLMVGYLLQVLGLKYTTASRSGFFTSLLVIMTPLLAHLLRTSKTPFLSLLGIPISMAGVYFMSDPEAGGLNLGDWLTIGCAVAFSAQMVALEFVAKRNRDFWKLTYLQMLMVGGGAIIWSLVAGNPLILTKASILGILYTALFGSIGAVWLQTRYQPEVTAGQASLIFVLEPVFASLFAWLLLNEGWTSQSLLGACLILTAMIWSSVVLWKKSAAFKATTEVGSEF